jgi:hypothetical protein
MSACTYFLDCPKEVMMEREVHCTVSCGVWRRELVTKLALNSQYARPSQSEPLFCSPYLMSIQHPV